MSDPNSTIVYKCPKGTRDYARAEQIQRERFESYVIDVFKLHGAIPLSTPVFEITDAITKGCDTDTSKETFQLIPEHDNTEKYTLRYDQTMPFARYCKQNNINKMCAYRIGDVFRRDQPNINQRRFRSFRQADYDRVSLEQDIPSSDAYTLSILLRIMLNSDLQHPFLITINTIDMLGDMMSSADIPEKMWQAVSRSLDKLEKENWKTIAQELMNIGIKQEQIDVLSKHCSVVFDHRDISKGTLSFAFTDDTKKYLKDLIEYLRIVFTDEVLSKHLRFKPSLARGLDYYTGLIFEVNVCSPKKKDNIGSVAAGGRYDGLCGEGTKCVGFSIGIDRITKYLGMPKKKDFGFSVWVIQINDECGRNTDALYKYKYEIMTDLSRCGIVAGSEMKKDVSMAAQIRYALKNEIPYIIFVGDEELRNGTVTLKILETKEQKQMTFLDAVKVIK